MKYRIITGFEYRNSIGERRDKDSVGELCILFESTENFNFHKDMDIEFDIANCGWTGTITSVWWDMQTNEITVLTDNNLGFKTKKELFQHIIDAFVDKRVFLSDGNSTPDVIAFIKKKGFADRLD